MAILAIIERKWQGTTGLTNRLKLMFAEVALQQTVRNERAALRAMDDRQLHDLGIDRVAAMKEAERSDGDLPADRLQALEQEVLYGKCQLRYWKDKTKSWQMDK